MASEGKESLTNGKKAGDLWHFKVAETSFPEYQTTPFRIIFLAGINHAIQVGLLLQLIQQLQQYPEVKWSGVPKNGLGKPIERKLAKKEADVKEFVSEYVRMQGMDKKLLHYFELALGSWQDGDKYMPLRTLAPSMALIATIIPTYSEYKNPDGPSASGHLFFILFKLAMMRIFAVGDRDIILAMANTFTAEDMKALIHRCYPASEFKSNLPRQVYGRLQIPLNNIDTIVQNMLECCGKIADVIKESNELVDFSRIQDVIASHDVPMVKKGRLLIWLFGCDLAQFGYCGEATWKDLALRMKNAGGLGPKKTITMLVDMAQKIVERTGSGDVDKSKIGSDVKKNGAVFVEECEALAKVINTLYANEFRQLHLPGFLPRDMEHMLCKLTRMNGRGDFKPPTYRSKRKSEEDEHDPFDSGDEMGLSGDEKKGKNGGGAKTTKAKGKANTKPKASTDDASGYSKLTVVKLKEMIKERGIKLMGKRLKAELVELLENDDEGSDPEDGEDDDEDGDGEDGDDDDENGDGEDGEDED